MRGLQANPASRQRDGRTGDGRNTAMLTPSSNSNAASATLGGKACIVGLQLHSYPSGFTHTAVTCDPSLLANPGPCMLRHFDL